MWESLKMLKEEEGLASAISLLITVMIVSILNLILPKKTLFKLARKLDKLSKS